MRVGAITDIGRHRRINEDNYHVETDGLFPYVMVADGMGGHQAGEVASTMVVELVRDILKEELNNKLNYVEAGETVRRAFINANNTIFNYAKSNYKVMGMGTTATLSMIYQDKIITAHVGDSRSYRISKSEIVQLTRDHSYVQELVSMGLITKEEAKHHSKKNYITRAMGAEETVKVDIYIKPYAGEKVLLCTDGLTNYLEDEEILEYINGADNLQSGAERLAETANERGGRDNITVAVIEKERENEQ